MKSELDFHYIGQERSARRILLGDNKATPEKLALLAADDIRKMILENYVVIADCINEILLIKKEDRAKFESLVKRIYREEK